MISPDLTTIYFVQESVDAWRHGELETTWRDVPFETVYRRVGAGTPVNPFDDINHAQAALDELRAHSPDNADFRIVGRPVSIQQE